MVNPLQIYEILSEFYEKPDWWPAETPFEVVVGAILTQNTNWNNVEKAIANLRCADVLTSSAILQIEREELEQLIRPSGFFRQKAERLQLFCHYLHQHYQGSLEKLLQREITLVRDELLSLKGIGPETADSILLYAGQRPSFVIDSYTMRLFKRLGVLNGKEKYQQVRGLFMTELPAKVTLYNQYHALIVNHCKKFCRKQPNCIGCPLLEDCQEKQQKY